MNYDSARKVVASEIDKFSFRSSFILVFFTRVVERGPLYQSCQYNKMYEDIYLVGDFDNSKVVVASLSSKLYFDVL